MEPSGFIGSSIFMYIIGFIIVMAIAAFFVYNTSQRAKRRRDQQR
jgi:uncharacterized membrane protein